jgi:NAD-dependent SIR2 family protein deacetylase
VLCGAGISTSTGIPDFRSPTTGLYANLARYNLPSPEAVFDLRFFARNPSPFFELSRELLPRASFAPTPAHHFLRLLEARGALRRCYTQNIDCLERAAGVPPERLVEAHGSFASSRCTAPR